MIVLASCGVHIYRPQSYASHDVLVDGTASPSYQGLPDLDQALSIIDQQILTLLDIYTGQDQDRIADLIIVDIDHEIGGDFGGGLQGNLGQEHNLQSLHFNAKAVVYCVIGQCQGVQMNGVADVDINLRTSAVSITNLHAQNEDRQMIVSGSIENILPHQVLEFAAKANLVLTINDVHIIMNPDAQTVLYGVSDDQDRMEAVFRAFNIEHRITLDGNVKHP